MKNIAMSKLRGFRTSEYKGFKLLLVTLLLLCTSISSFAIQDGDTITIKNYYVNNDIHNYLAINADRDGVINYQNPTPTEDCLWRVEKVDGGWYFISLADTTYYLYIYKYKQGKKDYYTLIVNNNASVFTGFNEANSILVDDITLSSANRYIACNGASWYVTEKSNQAYRLTIEKWTYKEAEGGGLIGEFDNAGQIEFPLARNEEEAAGQKVERTFTLKQESGSYIYCMNRPELTLQNNYTLITNPSFRSINFIWGITRTTTSQATCSNYEDNSVIKRNLINITSERISEDPAQWKVTITPVGSSPMNLKQGDTWINHVDNLVATFMDNNETRTNVLVPVVREAYHRVELPSFEVNASDRSYTFQKVGGTATINVSCFHQHGANILKSDDQTSKGIEYIIPQTDVTNVANITFVAKNMNDETNATWLHVNSVTNGVLSFSADDNSQNSTNRTARLVGTITYTHPDDPTDVHTEYLIINVTQKAKDGKTQFIPQKGYANTEFGKNPYTGENEQLVHTAEKTIYYLPRDTITLRLAEVQFIGYQRWYDYQTGGNPQYNNGSDKTIWITPPNGTSINNTSGDTYGIYNTGSAANTPIIKGWEDGKAHIMACDVSNYTDYTISPNTTNPEKITEPTLSYRQLWHLKPAAEMAEAFKTAAAKNKFLEYHTYTAPITQTIYLTTDYRYAAGDESDKSYYYYKNGTDANDGYNCVGKNKISAKWFEVDTVNNTYTNITPSSYNAKDYLSLTSPSVGTKVYELGVDVNNNNKIDDVDIRIARFVVKFVDNCGPSTTALITKEQIAARYIMLEDIDFNFGNPDPGDDITSLNHHLPWAEASYGYVYPDISGVPSTKRQGGDDYFPYWGEYFITKRVNKGFTHDVKAHTGYAMYIDGTSEPGLMASISTNAEICSGQTMYCSMWLNNVSNDGSANAVLPVFRCNIQGRNSDNEEWTDVGVFFVGAMERKNGQWSQINFPVLSDQESYAQTRVSIYNFATSAGGNDFMIDDICLYVSPLPLATYHQTSGCASYADSETTSTVVVVRIDYSQLQELNGGNSTPAYVYYQIVDVTGDSTIVELKDADNNPLYHCDNTTDRNLAYGSIAIPTEVNELLKRENVETFIEELGGTTSSGKCFVQDATTGKWFLYLVQTIPNGDSGDRNQYLDRDRTYILRVAYAAAELSKAACVFTSPLYAKQDTYIQLRNDQVDSLRITSCMDGLCANNHHFLDVKVSNAMSATVGGAMQTYEARVHADWLRGFADDDVYCDEKTATTDQINGANAKFEENYGCSREAIKSAIVAMRRVPSTEYPNPNYTIADPDKLKATGDFSEADLALIRNLCSKGLLQLYKQTIMFYLGSEASARYWVYPVAEDAQVKVGDQIVTLQDCDEPKWVKVSSARSDYGINLSPIHNADKTEHQLLDIPTIRVIEGTEDITIPIKQLLGETVLNSTLSATKENIVFNFKEPIDQVLEYVDLSNNQINIIDAPTKLEPGVEYLMRMAFYDKDGNVYIGGETTACRVGYIYFYIMAVPNRMEWTGARSNEWGDDRNWSGGRAPLPGSNVIIPADAVRYPVVGTTDLYPMDVNYYPNACDQIYFEPGAMIGNQHLLQYNKVFVDMCVTATTWNSMAAPMQGMYTGDMFIPHIKDDFTDNTNKESTDPFVVNKFEGVRTSTAPYAFWQSIYNKRVQTYHVNGNKSTPSLTDTEQFVQTNSLEYELTPGTGYQLLGYGPTNTAEELIIRLPKPDTEYSYYMSNGVESDQRAYVTHSPKLAFTPDDKGDMYITLTSDVASNKFMFGNPTMANINMKEFLEDNSDVLAAYYVTMDNSTWNAETLLTDGTNDALLAPMRSAMLQLKDGKTASSIRLKLSAEHLIVGSTASDGATNMPARRQVPSYNTSVQVMDIYSYSATGAARCVIAADMGAKDRYESNEDVLFFSSGVEQGVDGATATSPINIYTVHEQVPMMVDVRENIDTIPLSMLVHNSYRTEKVQFVFYLSLNWNKECYFCDMVTGKRYRIMDGLVLEMDMPLNHETRYYITGPDRASNDDVITSTTQPTLSQVEDDADIWAYSPDKGELVVKTSDIIKEVKVYDLTGHLVAHKLLSLWYNTVSLPAPSGICIVETTMRDNSKRRIQTLVR